MNIRRSVAATAVVLSALALAACSSDGDEKTAADPVAALKESGVLKVGTEGTYAPFTFHDPTSGELTGYDVEVITAVAEKLGVKPEFSETKWDSIFAGLEAKRYDVVANEVTINDERAAKYDLSDPYSVSVPVVIVPADDTELTDVAGFEGRTAAQTATSNWGALARDNGAKVEPIDGFTEAVTSPTYTIVNEYLGGRLPLFHFDMYRLSSADDLFDIGWEDYLDRGGVCAVEWSENVTEAMEGAVSVTIDVLGENTRRITISGGDFLADLSL